jgi:crotonobetainyl-CoA:carnitine CoA-transferase CaiB-like acyl-CoA transferase
LKELIKIKHNPVKQPGQLSRKEVRQEQNFNSNQQNMNRPLEGIIVLEFAQYLSGPSAGLRLADLGARVIKIERPGKGEAGRNLAIKNLWVDDNSLLFHTINRNKESFTADLNDPDDLEIVRRLIAKAHVLTHNFRPGVMEKKGLDYASVKQINPALVYAQISGYGSKGPWTGKPGQDLLIQAISGLSFTTGSDDDNPMPLGLGIGDYLCGSQTVQFILGALIRARKTGIGALLELSLLESLIDFQFEFLTTYFSNEEMPRRAKVHNAHALLSAPYGIYKTSDGFIAIAMIPIAQLNDALQCAALEAFAQEDAFSKRDEIKTVVAHHLLQQPTQFWLERAHKLDLWMMPVLNWQQLRETEGYKTLRMEQTVIAEGRSIVTTRCPIRFNKTKLYASKAAPRLGEDTQHIIETFL